MKTILNSILAILLAVSIVASGCGSIPDPGDKKTLEDAIAGMPTDTQRGLELEGRRQLLRDTLTKWFAGESEDTSVGDVTCQNKLTGKIETLQRFTLKDVRRWIDDTFNGTDIDSMWWVFKDKASKYLGDQFTNCQTNLYGKILSFIGESGSEINKKNRETKDSSRIVSDETLGYLIAGVIAVGVLVVVAPELLPVLCSLGRDVYCPDKHPPGTPTPPPADLPQYPGDGL